MNKIDTLITRIHITTETDDAGPGIHISQATPVSNFLAQERINAYADRHHLSFYDLGQVLYWPTNPDDNAHRRNIARIVTRALGH